MIIRSVFESYLRMVFISLYPQSWKSTVYNKKLKNLTNFNVSNFIRDQLKVDWLWIYKLLSRFPHGKQIEVLNVIGQIAKRTQKTPIAINLVFDENYFSMCFNFCSVLTCALLTLIKDFFPEIEDHPQLIQEAKERFQATLKGYHKLVEGMPNKLSNTEVDIMKISKMVRAAEKDENWRQLA